MERKKLKDIGKEDLLKQPDILKRKPDLKLCGNHFKVFKKIHRFWDASKRGTAKRDGGGWYK